MLKKKAKIRATISYIIVALLFVLIPIGIIQIVFGNQISEAISLVGSISKGSENLEDNFKTEINSETKRLRTYPQYGAKYGSIQIESLNIDLPLYYGHSVTAR